MKFENTDVWGFEHAIRGMRNPKNSWDRSDSECLFHALPNYSYDDPKAEEYTRYLDDYNLNLKIGPNDMKLMQALIKGGSEHRKFMRQIFVSVDITAPLYWWKEFDTYKVATVANSTSTMHKIQSLPITRESFEMDDYKSGLKIPITQKYANIPDDMFFEHDDMIDTIINYMEALRQEYNTIIEQIKNLQSDSNYIVGLQERANWVWKELIRWLPESWLQKRTITMNYENVRSMVHQRMNHKLNEWSGKDDGSLPNFIAWARTLPYAEELIFYGNE